LTRAIVAGKMQSCAMIAHAFSEAPVRTATSDVVIQTAHRAV